MATLIAFSGLPGVGKKTIAKLLAVQLSAVYLRIDTIERGLMDGGMQKSDIKGLGYFAGCRLAAENLSIGRIVVTDSVNSMQLTRNWWRAAAEDAQASILEVFIWCSDTIEHRRRVEERRGESGDANLPSWDEVLVRSFEPWQSRTLALDSAITPPNDAVNPIIASLPNQ